MGDRYDDWPDFENMSKLWREHLREAIETDRQGEWINLFLGMMLESAEEIVRLRKIIEEGEK